MFISCIFTVLLFGLVYSVLGSLRLKWVMASLCAIVALGFLIESIATSSFTDTRQKPNSLIYYQDQDTKESYWVTYDRILDDWTRGYLGEDPAEASSVINSAAGSKYNTSYSYATAAPYKEIEAAQVLLERDTLIGNERMVDLTIVPQRSINELYIYADTSYTYRKLTFNGISAETDDEGNALANVYNKRLLRFIVSDSDSLRVSYSTTNPAPYSFKLVEFSFDLMEHPRFSITRRPSNMMPKPFVNTDAVVINSSFSVSDLVRRVQDTTQTRNNQTQISADE